VDTIPIRLLPLPGEAIDSWLETYAHLLHAEPRDIFQLAGLSRRWDHTERPDYDKPWIYHLEPADLASLSTVTGVPAAQLASMTLACYEGTGLAATSAAAGMRRIPRWWRQPRSSQFCSRCLAGNGGRWLLPWRLPWTFACTRHHTLLAGICPACGRRHVRTRTGQPRHPGCCDTTGLPLPPPRPGRGARPCNHDLAAVSTPALPADGQVLRAQRHIDALITALLNSRSQPGKVADLQQELDDIYAVARACLAALDAPAQPPPAIAAMLAELGTGPGSGGAITRAQPGGTHRQSAPVVAFGTTAATIMLQDRHDPDPAVAAWLVDVAGCRVNQSNPAQLLARWKNASPPIQAALLKQTGPRLSAADQLRYGTPASTPRRPRPGDGTTRAAAMPGMLWRGWALRLNPAGSFAPLPYRLALSVLLLIADTDGITYRQAQKALGHAPLTDPAKFSALNARLRQAGSLDPVLSALTQLARQLDDHGAPIDYARRRRLRRLAQAQLDTAEWRRRRFLLTHPDTWAWRRHLDRADLPAFPRQEKFARLYLIELLTGTHPYFLPSPLRLPERGGQAYANFVFHLPRTLSDCLHQQARRLLQHAEIDEPACWEPPFDWVTGITWPGPDPASISPHDLHELIGAGLSLQAIAARLRTTTEHIRLTAARQPAPRPPGLRGSTVHPAPPTAEQVRRYAAQGFGLRKIAKLTGCQLSVIRPLLADAGTRPPPAPGGAAASIDPQWLREQYNTSRRSIKDIAAQAGVPADNLAAYALSLGITIRQGANAGSHALARFGGPSEFPPAVWAAFASPHAEQRIRRFLATPGHPDLNQAARHLGTRHALLTSQITQLETAACATLLQHTPGTGITLTRDGEQLAHDVRPVLDMLEHARNINGQNHPA
jgi:TniQ